MTPAEERSGDLLDVALADEIELVSDLVVAASSSPRHFTPQEVDELLGVRACAADGSPERVVSSLSNVPDRRDAPAGSA